MACDTFLKICNKCRRKFVILNVGEKEPFIVELLNGLTTTIQDLETHQIHTFYEAVALTIGAAADSDPRRREEYLVLATCFISRIATILGLIDFHMVTSDDRLLAPFWIRCASWGLLT